MAQRGQGQERPAGHGSSGDALLPGERAAMRPLLEAGLRRALCTWLTNRGCEPASAESLDRLAVLAFNLRRRLLPTLPWRVRMSHELVEHYLPGGAHAQAVRHLAAAAEGGHPLRAHQSKALDDADFDDALLNDWGINHLHLGLAPDRRRPEYAARTGPLLFVFPLRDELFFLDVLDHAAFAQDRLVDVLHRNFPEAIARHRAHALTSEFNPTAEQRRNLRANGGNAVVRCADGTLYLPIGGGVTTSRRSVDARVQADRLLSFADPHYFRAVLKQAGAALVEGAVSVDFELDEDVRVVRVQAQVPRPRPAKAARG